MALENKKVVLITGASSGIGKDAALLLAGEGHIVYGAARRAEKMQALVELGGHALRLDVTDEQQIASVVAGIIEDQGQIDVLVNNAGYAVYGAVEDVSLDEARRQFEVNVFGLAAMTKAVLPTMRAQGSGTIINITSMGGKVYTPLGAWYHGTKHALEGWSDCLRLELAPHGIDVVVVEPGAIATEFGDVVTGPMLQRSGNGPYGDLAKRVANLTVESYNNGGSSPPSVISELILRAIRARKPKTRYVAGKWAKPMMWMRKHLSDRTFDRIIMSQVK